MERDRDEAGKAKNSRARDELGRPLPRGVRGVDRIPDDLSLTPAETLRYAQELLDSGLAFNAHEVLEAAWKQCPERERDLWQGLAQVAVGVTHLQRDNPRGASALFDRARVRLAAVPENPYEIDLAGILDNIEHILAAIATDSTNGSNAIALSRTFSLLRT